MDVKIYRPAKTATQSGRAKDEWLLEYETTTARRPESLMGWTSSGDTLNQVRLTFATAEEAIAFAEKKAWTYTVQQPKERKVRARNYGDNFKYVPPKETRT